MKCAIPRCREEATEKQKCLLRLCNGHQTRYIKDEKEHLTIRPKVKLVGVQVSSDAFPRTSKGQQKWKVKKVTEYQYQGRRTSQIRRGMGVGEAASYVAHWVQMVDLEILNSGNGAGTTKVKWDEQHGWVPEGDEKPKSSYEQYAKTRTALPEYATKVGQAAIEKRTKEQNALERQLAADLSDYQRGRRMELELELKTKREAAARKAKS